MITVVKKPVSHSRVEASMRTILLGLGSNGSLNGILPWHQSLSRKLPHSLLSVLPSSSRWPTTGGRCGPSAAQGHCVFFSVSDKCIVTRKLTGKNYSNLALRAPSVFLCNFKDSQTSRKQHPKCKGLVVAYGTRSLTRTEPQGFPF